MTVRYHSFLTDLGLCVVGLSPSGVCFLQFGECLENLLDSLRTHRPEDNLEQMVHEEGVPVPRIETTIRAATRGHFKDILTLPIAPIGTEFQLAVWTCLRDIPSGEVRSYSEIAHALNIPRATRAVARACGANAIALLIPCHRVIRSDGSLGGYRWGLQAKRRLLAAERGAPLSPTSDYQGFSVTVDIPETI
jgi:AraC family transcriptional regulator of adaptative response/methylated-DNA-[protein]-cysteine methyltransferase